MNIEEIKKLKIDAVHQRMAEIKGLLKADDCEVDALEARENELKQSAEARKALMAKVASGGTGELVESYATTDAAETRANEFVQNHKIEMRAIVSTGKIVKPTTAKRDVSGLGETGNGIVDDVNAVMLNGSGSYTVPLKTARAKAGDATEGKAPVSTAPDFDYVTINPAEWATLDEVSKLVAKLSPVDYLSAVENSAVEALRDKACEKIVTELLTDAHIEKKAGIPLDQNYLRTIVLGYRPIKNKGASKLYLSQADLAVLGKVRGANEKKPVFDIEFDTGTVLSGTMKDGGLAVPFRVIDDLPDGSQLYGQPMNIDMPMWGNYEVSTDEGGKFFENRTIGVLGTQLAGSALTAVNGMQLITQAQA